MKCIHVTHSLKGLRICGMAGITFSSLRMVYSGVLWGAFLKCKGAHPREGLGFCNLKPISIISNLRTKRPYLKAMGWTRDVPQFVDCLACVKPWAQFSALH